jgi:hypothetical protein
MSRYKPEKFNFSGMSERAKFQVKNDDGTYSDSISVWAHFFKDGFTRSETDNFFKMMVREQKALSSILAVNNRVVWKNMTFNIFSWQDPSYEDRGFMEIMLKQIPTSDGNPNGPTDGDFFKDTVNIYKMSKIETNSYGVISYKYDYDFNNPYMSGVRCFFSTDRNQWLEDKNTDVEHDSLIVKFNIDAPISKEDYIESPIHGRFKVDMVIKNDENMLEAYVQRREVQ